MVGIEVTVNAIIATDQGCRLPRSRILTRTVIIDIVT